MKRDATWPQDHGSRGELIPAPSMYQDTISISAYHDVLLLVYVRMSQLSCYERAPASGDCMDQTKLPLISELKLPRQCCVIVIQGTPSSVLHRFTSQQYGFGVTTTSIGLVHVGGDPMSGPFGFKRCLSRQAKMVP